VTCAFVTGGSGFVGRNLIRALRARGDEVRALARSESSIAAVTALGAASVMGDLDDVHAMVDGMRGCTAVYHVAAEVSEWAPRERYVKGNIDGTRNVVEAAKLAGVPVMVHVSTEAVLADGSPLINVDETRARPANPYPRYPATKAASEALVQAANSPKLRTTIVRPRFIWGADDTSVMAQLVEAVKSGRFMWLDGGRYPTSTCHVANVVEGMLLAAEKGRGGECYFLTDGAPVQLKDFVTRMLATQGVQIPDKSIPRSVVRVVGAVAETIWDLFKLPGKPPATRVAACLFGQQVTVIDAKARKELGYRGKVSVEEGLEDLQRRAAARA
jgi:nucleoside-diphosphate-sugar epimerase